MAIQFTFNLPNTPGSLAPIAAALADVGINIDGIAGTTVNGQGRICLVTHDFESTKAALEKAGVPFETQEVLMVHLEDKPGQVAKLCRALGDEGINLNTFYITMGGYQVFAADNMSRAKEIASELGVI